MPRNASRLTLVLPVACLAAGALAVPGGAPADQQQAHASATTITISARSDDTLRFTKSKLSARAGKITLRMKNPSDLDHAIAIGSKEGRTVGKNGVSKLTRTLKRGKYTYYCPVSDHRQLGMRGTLTVR